MEELYCRLVENGQSDFYPYHMPGHKRRPETKVLERIGDIDITEIDGFDNLHHPEGILQRMQETAARVFGARESFYLVGGSTAGILSAVSAVVPVGGKLLMARGCHRSVYHSLYLRRLQSAYLFEQLDSQMDFGMAVTAQQVQAGLEEHPDAAAVLIVSPTYEGQCADVEAIAEVVHAKGIPLIVDSAHGAHLGFHPAWPETPVRQGADLVIQSLHKTLPAPTQTAILHVNGDLVDRDRLRRYLQIYQTSSPSYVLMAGIEQAIAYMDRQGREKMHIFWENWKTMLQALQACRTLRVYPRYDTEGRNQDIGKLTVSAQGAGVSGQQLYDLMREAYHLQPEMAGGSYVLFMFTVADEREGYDRLAKALLEVDARLRTGGEDMRSQSPEQQLRPAKRQEIWQAWEGISEETSLENCVGRTSGDFVFLYPPGIPVIAPGEIFDEKICDRIEGYLQRGLTVQGILATQAGPAVKVLRERE